MHHVLSMRISISSLHANKTLIKTFAEFKMLVMAQNYIKCQPLIHQGVPSAHHTSQIRRGSKDISTVSLLVATAYTPVGRVGPRIQAPQI